MKKIVSEEMKVAETETGTATETVIKEKQSRKGKIEAEVREGGQYSMVDETGCQEIKLRIR